jgi:hypothetical protein
MDAFLVPVLVGQSQHPEPMSQLLIRPFETVFYSGRETVCYLLTREKQLVKEFERIKVETAVCSMDLKYYPEKRISKCYFAGKSEKRFVEGKKLRDVACDLFLWSSN